jgi:hypothetical protein
MKNRSTKNRSTKNCSAFCLLVTLSLILAACFQAVDTGETFVEKGTAHLRVTNESADEAYVLEGLELRNAEGAVEQSWEGLDLATGAIWEVHTETAGTFTLWYRVKDMWISASEIKSYDGGQVLILLNRSHEFFFRGEDFEVTQEDADNDGFPDAWETENGFNPEDPADGGAVYVSRMGHDEAPGNGTPSYPYLTLAKAAAKASRGLTEAARTVVVAGTLTWATGGNDHLNLEYPGRNDSVFYLGKARNPLTIRGEGPDKPGTLTAENAGNKRVLYLDSGADVSFRDITITEGKGVGGGIYAYGANLTLGPGTQVKDNNKNNGVSGIEGGGIYMARGDMVMEAGSSVSGNAAYMCGGIKLFAATLTMNGGTISGNQATYAIAGIRVENSTLKMLGEAEISGNTVGVDNGIKRDVGGGATIIFGEIIMSGASKITGNKTYNGWAGGVLVSGEGVLTMEDNSEISDNQCVFHNSLASSVVNSSIGRGAGVFVDYGGSLRMKGGAITRNTADYSGGGIFVHTGASVDMKGGKITGNGAPINGGGIILNAGASFNMEGGEITGNTAGDNGGGVYLGVSASFNMAGGEIANNTAAKAGGGIYLYGAIPTDKPPRPRASFTMTGGHVYGSNGDGKKNVVTAGDGKGHAVFEGKVYDTTFIFHDNTVTKFPYP